MKAKKGLWPALERLTSGAALLVDWQRVLGDEFDAAKAFLQPTAEKSSSYPCMDPLPCGCRHRIVEPLSSQNPTWPNAACQCEDDDCSPFFVAEKDRIIWKLDVPKLSERIRKAAGFDKCDAEENFKDGRVALVGTWGMAQSWVFLASPHDSASLLRQINQVANVRENGFILLIPSLVHHTEEVSRTLARQRSLMLAADGFLHLDGSGRFSLVNAEGFNSLLNDWAKRNRGDTSAPEKRAKATVPQENGRLRWANDFKEIRLGDALYNLENRKKARYCLQYLISKRAFDEGSARHLENEIDPFVRKMARMVALPESSRGNLRIQQYFLGNKTTEKLCRELVRSAGNGRFYLLTK